jgi:hypothetical protein
MGGSWLEASPDKQFMRLKIQNNQSKMDWGYGSNSSSTGKKKKKLTQTLSTISIIVMTVAGRQWLTFIS